MTHREFRAQSGLDPSVVIHSLSRQNEKLEKNILSYFFPVSLRNNWHISLCKFKAYKHDGLIYICCEIIIAVGSASVHLI